MKEEGAVVLHVVFFCVERNLGPMCNLLLNLYLSCLEGELSSAPISRRCISFTLLHSSLTTKDYDLFLLVHNAYKKYIIYT